jgi:hypothetical protein
MAQPSTELSSHRSALSLWSTVTLSSLVPRTAQTTRHGCSQSSELRRKGSTESKEHQPSSSQAAVAAAVAPSVEISGVLINIVWHSLSIG